MGHRTVLSLASRCFLFSVLGNSSLMEFGSIESALRSGWIALADDPPRLPVVNFDSNSLSIKRHAALLDKGG